MPILFFVNCERTILFSVKRDLDPSPLPPIIGPITLGFEMNHLNKKQFKFVS